MLLDKLKNILASTGKRLRSVIERWQIFLHDLIAIPIAWEGAYWLRYNLGVIPEVFAEQSILLLPYVVVTQAIIYIVFGIHKGLWRFTSMPDMFLIIKSTLLSTITIAVVIFFATRLTYVPRSIFVFYAILLALILCTSRTMYRLMKDQHFSTRIGKRALVVGAGVAGEQVVRDLKRVVPQMYDPVAFVDDDLSKVGQEIRGIPVVATCDKIQELCEKLAIELIIIAIPSADDKQMQRIVSLCEETAVNFRTLPGVQDIVSGRVNINDMREVRIEDLLGRDPVSLEWDEIRQSLTGRTVLVTGGGGSIGSELSRLVAEFEPLQLIIFEQSEFNLYQIDHEISQRHPKVKLITILGDVCDRKLVKHIFSSFRPDIVFHAAAYKHVPILQGQLREGVKNNVLGTRNVALAADEYAVERFVFISTDKAVNPGNWMGVTKRVAEVFCQALDAESETSYVIVRFGNVLDSAGSVVPLFRQQLKNGGPITVTHPDVTRYFMTIREASQLILEASSFGQNGEIYVLDMGKPIKISFLAEQMVRLSGKEPGKDIDIVFTGLRPGEKLEEELFYPDEMLTATGYEKIFLANSRKFKWVEVEKSIQAVELHTQNFDEALIAQELHLLVPEIRSEICSVMPAMIPSVA